MAQVCRRGIGWLAVVILLWVAVVSAYAQPRDIGMRVWLYNPDSGEMLLVGITGVQDRLILPLPAGYDTYSREVVVSPDGRYMAYVVLDDSNTEQQLLIYDYSLRSLVGAYGVAGVVYNSLMMHGGRVFNPASSELAFGYALESGEWELVVIDMATLALRAVLRSGDPAAAAIPVGYGLTPTPVYFRPDGAVAFAMVLGGAGGALEYESFVWDVERSTVESSIGYGSLALEIFPPTGEVVAPYSDDRLPASADRFNFGQANALMVYDPLLRVRYPFYNDFRLDLSLVRFVSGGEFMIVQGMTGEPDYRHVASIIDRAGNAIASFAPGVVIRGASSMPDGYVVLAELGDRMFLGFADLSVSRLGDLGFSAWESDPMALSWRLVWAGLGDGSPLLVGGSYPPWERLADFTVAPGSGTPFEEPEPPLALTVGATATVRTTEGDALNLRTGPGTQFQRIARLPSGLQVTLLEGPILADGFSWWRIRTPDNQEGWVVEAAGDVVTLVPGRGASTGGEIDERIGGRPDPSLGSLIRVGDTVEVTLVSRRDALRLRNAPSINDSRVIQLMPNGTRVRVVDGPRDADGYRWWQLRTPEGNVGWAAEIIGSERTLMPVSP